MTDTTINKQSLQAEAKKVSDGVVVVFSNNEIQKKASLLPQADVNKDKKISSFELSSFLYNNFQQFNDLTLLRRKSGSLVSQRSEQ